MSLKEDNRDNQQRKTNLFMSLSCGKVGLYSGSSVESRCSSGLYLDKDGLFRFPANDNFPV
jgi:hypothetical protein